MSEEEEEEINIEVVGNNIYFYSDVSVSSILKFNTELRKLTTTLLKKSFEIGVEPEINIYIQSNGGDLYAGLSAMDHIWNNEIHVNTVIDGCVCSAATLMLLGGHTRYVMPHSYILIHQFRTGFWGRFEDLKDEHKNCMKLMDLFKNVYKKYTKIPPKKLDELLSREIYLDSSECIEYSIVDFVYR